MKRKLAGLLIAVMAMGTVGTVVLADEGTYVPGVSVYAEFAPSNAIILIPDQGGPGQQRPQPCLCGCTMVAIP